MRFTKKPLHILAGLSLALLIGCGGDDQLPNDTKVVISPDTINWETQSTLDANGSCIVFEDFYVDELITVRVEDGSGRPLGDTEIIVTLALAENTSGSLVRGFTSDGNLIPVVSMYDDRNGNMLPDEDELVSGGDDPLLITKTEEYTGSKTILVRMNVSCGYRSRLSVNAGGYYESIEIEVEES